MKVTQDSQCLNFETFFRSNQDTCLSQRPLVKQGQWVNRGQLLADSITSVLGDLSLGNNILVAYMPWEGYNFEDSIVISDRLVADDVYTSLHILRFKTEIDFTSKEIIPEEDVPDSLPNLESELPSFLGNLPLPLILAKAAAMPSKLPLPLPMKSSLRLPLASTPLPLKSALPKTTSRAISNATSLKSFAVAPAPAVAVAVDSGKGNGNGRGKGKGNGKDKGYKVAYAKGKGKSKGKGNLILFAQGNLKGKKEDRSVIGDEIYEYLFKEKNESYKDTANERLFHENVSNEKRFHEDLADGSKQVLNVEMRTNNIPFLGNHLLSHLDPDGIPKVGAWLSPGDILVGKVRAIVNKLKSNRAGTQLALEIISRTQRKSIALEDTSFRLPMGVRGRVLRTEIFSTESNEQIHIYLAVKRKIQVGDKLAGRHGNKGIVSLILPRQEMPYLVDGTPIDVILSPLGVPSRMNVGQIYECLLGLAAKSLGCDFIVNNSLATLTPNLFAEPPSLVHSNVDPKKIKHLAPASGAALEAAEDKEDLVAKGKKDFYEIKDFNAPALAFALAVAVAVASGKGKGKGKGNGKGKGKGKGIGPQNIFSWKKPQITSHTINSNKKKDVLKDRNRYFLGTKYIFGNMSCKVFEKNTTKSMFYAKLKQSNYRDREGFRSKAKTETLPYSKMVQRTGLLFSSTLEARSLVFLKLYYSRITCNKRWLFSLTNPGKNRLFDGRTGQPFVSWVTVGYSYMLKLIHLVDTKIHSRSTGPYSIVTRQAVAGKARHGGQRIGEMEAWALEGFGAAYTLHELFSFKGDDVSLRHQRKIGRVSRLVGNNTSFKTLLSELRALCVTLDFTAFMEHL